MKLFSSLSRQKAPSHSSPVRRHRPEIESLEARELMAANLYLDFGFALPNGSITVTDTQMRDPGLNGPTVFSNGWTLTSLTRSIQNQKIDLNGDGKFDVTDANILANKVIASVQRTFAPFDVNVIAVSSANLSGIKSYLAQRTTHDAYILIAGDSPLVAGNWGIGPEDTGNTQDNLATVFVDKALRDTVRATSWDQRVNAIALAIDHEAGHTFGLHHSDYSQSITAGDVMGAPSPEALATQPLFTRFTLPREGGGTQNAYNLLGANVGFKPGFAAYVTGTGVDDTINISWFATNQARVDVYAYDGSGIVKSQTYFVSLANGIQVEAGNGNDYITVDARLGTTVDIRGGAGRDQIVVNAAAGPTVLTVNGDTVTASSTLVRSDTFWESEGLTINGNSLTTVNVQSTRTGYPLTVFGAGTVNIGWSGSLNSVFGNIAGDITIFNQTGKTAINVDDSKDTAFRDQVKVAAADTSLLGDGSLYSYIQGLAPGTIYWTPSQVSSVLLQTGTGGATVNVVGNDGALLTLAGNSNNTTVNLGNAGRVAGILSEVHIQNTPAYTTVNIDDSDDRAPRTITFDNDRITGLAQAPITFNAFDLQALNVKAGNAGNAVYVNNTPVHGQTTLDTGTGDDAVYILGTRAALTVNGDGGNDITNIGNAGTVAGIKGNVLLTGHQSLTIGDAADQLVRDITIDSWNGRYDTITGLAPAMISYVPATDWNLALAGYEPDGVTDVTLLAGPGVAGINLAGTHAPLTLYTQNFPSIYVGKNGSVQNVTAPVKIQSLTGFNAPYFDDSADQDARTVTVDIFTDDDGYTWGRIDGLAPGQFTFNVDTTAYTGGTPQVTVRTGTGGGEVDLLSAKGATFNLALGGDTLIRLGNQGSVDDLRTTVGVTSVGGVADIYIDDSLNQTAKAITLAANNARTIYGGYESVRGLTPRGLTLQMAAVRYLEVDAGMGGNTFTISGQTAYLTRVNTGAGDDTVTLQGNVSGVSVDGQDGVNTLYGPDTTPVGTAENVWMIDGLNSGNLNGGSVAFGNVNIVGGAAADHFIMYDSLGLAGLLDGGGGVNTLDYSYWTSDVYVNLQTGTASGFPGGVVNIQNVTGGAGTNLLVGNGGNVLTGGAGRNILIAGGDSTLIGGAGENVLIAGTTVYDTDDATLQAMLTTWGDAGADFDTRLAALPTLDATTVTPGPGGSVLTGNGARDAFFARMGLDVVVGMDELNDVVIPL
jgi:hypothetical protein